MTSEDHCPKFKKSLIVYLHSLSVPPFCFSEFGTVYYSRLLDCKPHLLAESKRLSSSDLGAQIPCKQKRSEIVGQGRSTMETKKPRLLNPLYESNCSQVSSGSGSSSCQLSSSSPLLSKSANKENNLKYLKGFSGNLKIPYSTLPLPASGKNNENSRKRDTREKPEEESKAKVVVVDVLEPETKKTKTKREIFEKERNNQLISKEAFVHLTDIAVCQQFKSVYQTALLSFKKSTHGTQKLFKDSVSHRKKFKRQHKGNYEEEEEEEENKEKKIKRKEKQPLESQRLKEGKRRGKINKANGGGESASKSKNEGTLTESRTNGTISQVSVKEGGEKNEKKEKKTSSGNEKAADKLTEFKIPRRKREEPLTPYKTRHVSLSVLTSTSSSSFVSSKNSYKRTPRAPKGDKQPFYFRLAYESNSFDLAATVNEMNGVSYFSAAPSSSSPSHELHSSQDYEFKFKTLNELLKFRLVDPHKKDGFFYVFLRIDSSSEEGATYKCRLCHVTKLSSSEILSHANESRTHTKNVKRFSFERPSSLKISSDKTPETSSPESREENNYDENDEFESFEDFYYTYPKYQDSESSSLSLSLKNEEEDLTNGLSGLVDSVINSLSAGKAAGAENQKTQIIIDEKEEEEKEIADFMKAWTHLAPLDFSSSTFTSALSKLRAKKQRNDISNFKKIFFDKSFTHDDLSSDSSKMTPLEKWFKILSSEWKDTLQTSEKTEPTLAATFNDVSLDVYIQMNEEVLPLFKYYSENNFIHCQACDKRVSGYRNLKSHIEGKRHISSMSNTTTVEFTPKKLGETALITLMLNKYDGAPLVGLEYVIERFVPNTEDPLYYCRLCNRDSDAFGLMSDLIGPSHRLEYLQTYFPTAGHKFAKVKNFKFWEKSTFDSLESVVFKIEKKHGRLYPIVTTEEDFITKKLDIFRRIESGPHFSESHDLDFSSLPDPFGSYILKIPREEITQDDVSNDSDSKLDSETQQRSRKERFRRQKKEKIRSKKVEALLSSSSSSKRSISRFEPPQYSRKKQHLDENIKTTRWERRDSTPRYSSSSPRYSSSSPSRRRASRIKESSFRNSSAGSKKESWHYYNEDKKQLLDSLYRSKDLYDKYPEDHPDYGKEWTIFWKRRSNELSREGVDIECYDFKSEWIPIWTQRVEEIFQSELDYNIKKLQRKYDVKEKERHYEEEDDYYSNHQDQEFVSIFKNETSEIIFNEDHKFDVISVIRSLLVLDDILGPSLSKVIENLLSRAHALEKKQRDLSHILMEDGDVAALFEVVTEVLSEKLEGKSLNSSKAALVHSTCSSLIHLVKQMTRKRPENNRIISSSTLPVSLLKNNESDVQESIEILADQLTKALVQQRLLDISNESLIEIINEVVKCSPIEIGGPYTLPDTSDPNTPFYSCPLRTSPITLISRHEEDFEDLTLDELRSLLSNFNNLSKEEQRDLIEYMRKLETTKPQKVLELRALTQNKR